MMAEKKAESSAVQKVEMMVAPKVAWKAEQ